MAADEGGSRRKSMTTSLTRHYRGVKAERRATGATCRAVDQCRFPAIATGRRIASCSLRPLSRVGDLGPIDWDKESVWPPF